MKKTTPNALTDSRSLPYRRLIVTSTAVAALLVSLSLHGALPTPLVNLRFSEGTGVGATNSGSLGGEAAMVQPDGSGFPLFTNLTPAGVFAPAANTAAIDLGAIAAAEYGRAVDLTTTGGDGSGTLGALTKFTICGWLNARALTEGPGGNRVAFALDAPNGSGFDLVQSGNGSLRIGINQWPDGANNGGPASSAGKIKADPQAGPDNWVFFAVTYNPSLAHGNLKYFFGGAAALASPDTEHDYLGLNIGLSGEMPATGPLTVGNFGNVVGARNDPGGNSRGFRGLIDEVKIYAEALDLAGIQEAQLNGALVPVAVNVTRQPANATTFTGQAATFDVQVTGTAPFTFQWQRGTVDIAGETNSSYTLPAAAAGDNGITFRVRVSNPVTPAGIFSDPATLTVLPENNLKVSFSFSDTSTSTTNNGNLNGSGVIAQSGGYPILSQNVPTGPYAPPNNTVSLDFGTAVVGGRAVDLTNGVYGGKPGPMNAFTICGWINLRDLAEGGGGNRLVNAHAFNADPGIDLCQRSGGTLQMGVNSWGDYPEAGPVSSVLLTADRAAGPNNWVFFAATYDNVNITYFFGTPNSPATQDVQGPYSRGGFTDTPNLTVGNFCTADMGARNSGDSRTPRGLMDEVKVYNRALSLAEIQAAQIAPAYTPVVSVPISITKDPQSTTAFEGRSVSFSVEVTGTPPYTFQWWKMHSGTASMIAGATSQTYTLSPSALGDNGDQFWVVVSNLTGDVTSQKAMLTVLAENGHKVSLSFSEGSGTTTANLGNIGGSAVIVQQGGFPVFATVVPVGPFAPANNSASLNVGVMGDTDGGRAVDLTGSVTPTIGSMTAFTVTGWINCQDLRCGWGGNRILICQSASGQGGFDLTQNADGTLWMGVNTWPDGNPNSPSKSNPVLTEDPAAGNANWVFFAFTYDSSIATGNASYYFGKPDQAATLDTTFDHNAGPINNVGALSVDNFSTLDPGARNGTGPTTGSRCFRGFMDELNVFNKVLTIAEIQAAQLAPAGVPVQTTSLTVSLQGGQTVISWTSSASLQLQKRADLGPAGSWTNEATPPVVNGNQNTVTLPNNGSALFFRLVGP